ncbi:Aste57867_1621 [Aphanomyces stellatus]|uniref:Aste57867_1621 protein n=1 Tax=Aphanomyces stellatus TaxID=120398 RepID=A0A485K8A1_9STRA|nr:hypothetical protein As57867_001619 [Aphanomyces stellatus]VFT78834.1 Aste57867_1621 [Aphanomyces stellatus]
MSQEKRKRAGRNTPAEPGDDIIALRVVNRTCNQYEGTLARLARWLEQQLPECLENGEIKLPISVSVCNAFLTYSSYKRSRSGMELVPQRYNSNATISGVVSAIKYLYTDRSQTLEHDLKTTMNEFSAGYKRKIAQLRSIGQLPLTEGKSPMSVAGYRYLALHAMQSCSDFNLSMTAHSFLVLCWNLMARSITTASIRLEHVTWRGDALVVEFGLAKNDQTGEMCYPRHIYANPTCPDICPILR